MIFTILSTKVFNFLSVFFMRVIKKDPTSYALGKKRKILAAGVNPEPMVDLKKTQRRTS